MKFFLRLLLLLSVLPLSAQTGIYIPSAKPIKNMQRAMVNPEHFCLLIHYPGSAPDYPVDALDWLDSAYSVAFSRSNPMLYSITIEGYSNNQSLNTQRVDAVYNYFANRSYAPFPIRYAANPISCHCHGDTLELVRYEVPVDRRAFITNDLPPSRRTFNGSIDLDNCVLVSFRNNPDECLGAARGCIIPAHDTTIRAYYASVFIKQGALYSVRGTKDTCPPNPLFSIEEHLDYRPILEDYFLVPHRKQIILQVGYVVLHSSINRAYGECSQPLPDSIYVRFPVTQDQLDSKIRIFGKKHSPKGTEYKALTTKKIPSKVSLNIQAAINVSQLDTIFLGKRIQPDEIDDYFYECKTDLEQGSFTYNGRHYKAYRLDRHGNFEIKKPLRLLLRIVDDEPDPLDDDDADSPASDPRYSDDESLDE